MGSPQKHQDVRAQRKREQHGDTGRDEAFGRMAWKRAMLPAPQTEIGVSTAAEWWPTVSVGAVPSIRYRTEKPGPTLMTATSAARTPLGA